MRDPRFFQAFGPWRRSAPFLLLRLALALAIAGAAVAATVAGAVVGSLLDAAGDAAAGRSAFWGAAAGFCLAGVALCLGRARLRYRIGAGHLAVLARLIDGDAVPRGHGQLGFAAAAVRARFPEPSSLLALDQLGAGIVRAFNRAMAAQTEAGAGASRSIARRIAGAVASVCALRLQEAVLAQTLRAGPVNPWAAARDAVVLFAEHRERLLAHALGLAAIGWLSTLAVFAAALAPMSRLLAPVPGMAGLWTAVLTAALAVTLKAALIDPLTLTALLRAWAFAVAGERPRQAWAAQLNAATGGFRILGQEALGWVDARPARPDPRLPGRTAVS